MPVNSNEELKYSIKFDLYDFSPSYHCCPCSWQNIQSVDSGNSLEALLCLRERLGISRRGKLLQAHDSMLQVELIPGPSQNKRHTFSAIVDTSLQLQHQHPTNAGVGKVTFKFGLPPDLGWGHRWSLPEANIWSLSVSLVVARWNEITHPIDIQTNSPRGITSWCSPEWIFSTI
jgi:hypothetical protein